MREVGGSDARGDWARSGRGAESSHRSGSPPRETRHGSSSHSRHRYSTRSEHDGRRSRDHSRHRSSDLVRRQPENHDLIPRYRGGGLREKAEKSSRRSRSRDRDRGHNLLSSSPSVKRHRDKGSSFSPDPSHQKRSKKSYSPSRRERGSSRDPDSRKRRRVSPHDRSRRSVSRSQASNEPLSAHAVSRSSRHDRPSTTSRSMSPTAGALRRRNSRSPSGRASRLGHSFDVDYDRRSSHRQAPPRSPHHAYRDPRRREIVDDPYYSSRADYEEDMALRGSYRTGTNSLYAPKPSRYGGESRPDPYDYPQSPQRGGSYHTSPTVSPYGAPRGPWTGQYSPQHHHHSQYHHGRGGHGGHGGHHASSFAPDHSYSHHHHSPPHVPSGPGQPHPHGSYRESYRGNGSRGGTFSSRGGHRHSSAQNPQWEPTTKTATPSFRGQDHHPRDGSRHSNEAAQSRNASREPDTGVAAPSQNSALPIQSPVEDVVEPQRREDTSVPSSAPPLASNSARSQPTAPGKFSFSFKSASKPTPTAPKLEISQKFNAVRQKKQPEPRDGREDDRPRSTNTAPSSARPRHDPRDGYNAPRPAPRVRRYKKMVRTLKARPTLPPDLAASESVFFRKPGNESVVGSGTYGKVFKGLNVYTKGLVALKRIRMEGERDGFPVTAMREIKLLQSLRHTNIVNLQEVMVEKNDCFMVFEYLSHDLTGLLNHPSFKLEPAQRKHLAKQLFEGLEYLHTRGVLHRDIKAANILVSNEGVLKLADFGLARFYAKRHQLDYTNRVITIWYRSPELLLGETQYSAAVDVWSAACVMVEIFTRQPMFPGDGSELSQLEKIYSILGTPNRQEWPGLVSMAWFELLRPTAKRKSVFAEHFRDKVTPAAFDLLSSMFQYDPCKRPTAAEALQHVYFASEEPAPRQAVELANIDGEWHEFESKALRKENERREREARRAAKDQQVQQQQPLAASREKDTRKRVAEAPARDREIKRAHVD